MKKLKAAGIPTVSVFISGRPLWVNPELNASDAFVAAWLPGTEGGGVADVLVAKPDGSVNYDFKVVLKEAEVLKEVVIYSGKTSKKNNPALDILRKIWARKKKNGLPVYY